MSRLSALLLCVTLMMAGCGYTTGSLLPSNYRTIHVEPFKNKVAYLNPNVRGLYVPLLENKAHDAIVSRFQMDGHLKIASTTSTADLILQGDLSGFDREDVRINDDQNVQEYRVRVTVNLKLIDPASGEAVWVENGFSGEATYYLTGQGAKSDAQAIDEALVDLGRRVLERTIENW